MVCETDAPACECRESESAGTRTFAGMRFEDCSPGLGGAKCKLGHEPLTSTAVWDGPRCYARAQLSDPVRRAATGERPRHAVQSAGRRVDAGDAAGADSAAARRRRARLPPVSNDAA